MRRLVQLAGAAMMLSLSVSAPARAAEEAECWTSASVGAARLRELQIMFMGVSLRCVSKGVDIRPNYENFLAANKKALNAAHDQLKLHYGIATKKIGNGEYDQFQTRLANHYGTGKTDVQNCKSFGVLMDELSGNASSPDMLASVAMDMVRDPRIDGTRCALKPR
jgi:hypothetical protein